MTDALHTRTWGRGSRRAVLLHGSTSSSETWWQLGPRLARKGWSVVAFDLPGHGDSPAPSEPLTPTVVAPVVAANLPTDGVDLLVGHSFGAAVAVTLAAHHPTLIRRLVLEELPGGHSVDWAAEADAVPVEAVRTRTDVQAATARTRRDQPRWQIEDCKHAVTDLARCASQVVSDGLLLGVGWTPAEILARVRAPTTLLLAPDRPGISRLEDSTALRATDRLEAVAALRAIVALVDAGHCIHRDDPNAWLEVVLAAPLL